MLKSYEAIYENGRVRWLNDRPSVESARLIVTVVEEMSPSNNDAKRRTLPLDLVGQIKILDDIVGPIVDEVDWECLK